MNPSSASVFGDGEHQLRLLIENVTDYAMVFTDPERRVVTWNTGAERMMGWNKAEVIGQSADIFFSPEDRARNAPANEAEKAARDGRATNERWHLKKDGSRFWGSGILTALRDDAGNLQGFCKIFRDRTEERQAQEDFRAQRNFTGSLVDSVAEGLYAVDTVGRVTFLNPAAERMLGWREADLIGRNVHDAIHYQRPDGTPFPQEECELLAVLRSGESLRSHEDVFLRKDGSPLPVLCSSAPIHVDGVQTGAVLAFTDISERLRTEAELREHDARLQFSLDCAQLGTWQLDLTTSTATRDLRHDRIFGYETLLPEWSYDRFLQHVHPDDRAAVHERYGEALAAGTPWEFECRITRADSAERWIWARGIPYHDTQGRPVRLLGAVEDITERREIEARRASAYERERLINQIGQTVRATTDPAEIQARVVEMLGAALVADRCFFAMFDTARDYFQIACDWHGADLPSLAGEYRISDLGVDVDELFKESRSLVQEDAQQSPLSPSSVPTLSEMQIRSVLSVPFYDVGHLVAVLTVAMANSPRAWSVDEVALVEAAATEVRTAVEAARVLQREKAIASQLQAALQPPLPAAVPGIQLAQHCRVALDEAEVGGDFYDVFPLGGGCTALVVGDMAGKGLAAAAQVAVVRNMLRFTLYDERPLTEAVTALNRVLIDNELIEGFATLFVGCFDNVDRTLTYINCGQEPALLRRASTGQVEELGSSGPVLGGFVEAAMFRKHVVPMRAGDALAIFTDGLTEAGPNRTDLLGVAGIAELLLQRPPDEDAASLAAHIIQDVNTFARGGIRDDVCLLVGIVQD